MTPGDPSIGRGGSSDAIAEGSCAEDCVVIDGSGGGVDGSGGGVDGSGGGVDGSGGGVERGNDETNGGTGVVAITRRSDEGVIARGNSGAAGSETRSARASCAAGAGATSTAIGSGTCAILRVTFIFNVAWRRAPSAAAPEFDAGPTLAVAGSILTVAPRVATSRSREIGTELGGELGGELGARLRFAKNSAISARLAT